MATQEHPSTSSRYADHHLQFLLPDQIEMIDEALGCIGEFGEVRLVVEKGVLRFIVVNTSVDVRKWNGQKTKLLSPDRS
ncbi:MAG: hypothetical protein ROW39_08630 [Anaerolineaceae bacterium]|jgi:hypothetical protein